MIEWKTSKKLVPMRAALDLMQERVDDIHKKNKPEFIWMLEHPNIITGGTSAKKEHLKKTRIQIEQTGRGGSYTYHGPGQRVIYVMLDLRNQGRDIKRFVWKLEEWIILSLKELGIFAERRLNRVGVWVQRKDFPAKSFNSRGFEEYKVAAIGLRLRKWISFYGISINVNPNLSHFDDIIPCGNDGFGVTSLHDLGLTTSIEELDIILKQTFYRVFISR